MKLKPCPFCGGRATVTYAEHSNIPYKISCSTEGCFMYNWRNYYKEKDAQSVEKWNIRAIDKDLLAVEGRLKHLLQSDVVRLYDELDPIISDYTRDISELDHLVFGSKREEKKEKTAHWDINCDGYYPFCSHCGEATQHMSRFCPNCGYRLTTRKHGDD